MKKITDKQLIAELLQVMRTVENTIPVLSYTDYYGHPYYSEKKDDLQIRWTNFNTKENPHVILEVTKKLYGKYDNATLSKICGDNNNYAYIKELIGMGSGFYADVGKNGEIINSEHYGNK